MLAALQVRAAARVTAVLCLVGLCAGNGAVAQSVPPLALAEEFSFKAETPVAAEIQLAALAPADFNIAPVDLAPITVGKEPFGMAPTRDGVMAAKWRSLQPALQAEARMLDLCRSDAALCTTAAARFLAIIDTARARNGRARIGEINRAINLAIRPESDLVRFHAADVWTTPLMTLAAGAGDCEDYAIAKYAALRQAGFAAGDVRLVIMRNAARGEDHAVTAVRVDGEWLILDNRHLLVMTDGQVTGLTPLLTLDDPTPPATTVAQAG